MADSIEPINFGSYKVPAAARFYADLVSQTPPALREAVEAAALNPLLLAYAKDSEPI